MKEGFYKVKVCEFDHIKPFWTIGLFRILGSTSNRILESTSKTGIWYFAEGDGDEFGSGFKVLEIGEFIQEERVYVK